MSKSKKKVNYKNKNSNSAKNVDKNQQTPQNGPADRGAEGEVLQPDVLGGAGPGAGVPGAVSAGQGASGLSYSDVANRASGAGVPGQVTRWLACYLWTDNRDDPVNLTLDEITYLVFKKLELPREKIITIDTSAFKMVRIEVKADLDIELYKKAYAIELRRGVKVLPMKEVKKEKEIFI